MKMPTRFDLRKPGARGIRGEGRVTPLCPREAAHVPYRADHLDGCDLVVPVAAPRGEAIQSRLLMLPRIQKNQQNLDFSTKAIEFCKSFANSDLMRTGGKQSQQVL